MPEDETQHKILHLLDVLSVKVGAIRTEMAEVRSEMRTGFADVRTELRTGLAEVRTEMRTGFDRNLETRVESNETEFRAFRGEIDGRVTVLENQTT